SEMELLPGCRRAGRACWRSDCPRRRRRFKRRDEAGWAAQLASSRRPMDDPALRTYHDRSDERENRTALWRGTAMRHDEPGRARGVLGRVSGPDRETRGTTRRQDTQ